MIKRNKNQVKIEFGNDDIVMKNKTINSFKTGIIGFLENSLNVDYSKYLTDDGEADAEKYQVVMLFPNTKSIDNVIKQLEGLKELIKNTNKSILLLFPGMEVGRLFIFDSPAHILLLLSIQKNDVGEISEEYSTVNINENLISYINEYDKNGVIVLPCYDEIRALLQENNIEYKLIYPDKNAFALKEKIMSNIRNPYYCKKAGEMIENYDDSISKLNEDTFGEKIEIDDYGIVDNLIYKYI